MEVQLKFVSKEEAHRLIDEAPGNGIMILTYNNEVGISDNGKYIKKGRGKRLVDKATVLVLAETSPAMMLNLHDRFFNDFSCYEREDIIRSIMLPKLE